MPILPIDTIVYSDTIRDNGTQRILPNQGVCKDNGHSPKHG